MALPRIGLIEAALLIIAVFILAGVASMELFMGVFMYVAGVIFLMIALREGASIFLKDKKVLKHDLSNPGYAFIYSLPVALVFTFFFLISGMQTVSIFLFVSLIIVLGLFIHAQYKFKKKDTYQAYLLAAGIMTLLVLFEIILGALII